MGRKQDAGSVVRVPASEIEAIDHTRQSASVALVMARNFKPSGDPQQILAKQSEMARKAFDAAIDHTRQSADQVSKASAEALKIASDRIVESIAEIRASFEQAGDRSKPKT